mmetsp:Transcript_35651/g.105331  ORF Transcript_35651/g.105331 Transcript_35651/m.105331 type:complete len:456 (+) Transcript_35651:2838-4205(+)
MHHHALELVDVVVARAAARRLRHGSHLRWAALQRLQTVSGVAEHVERDRKLKPLLDLVPLRVEVVVLKALEVDHQRLRQPLDAHALECRHAAADFLAEVGVLPLHQLTLHVGFQALLQTALALDVHADLVEVLLQLAAVVDVLADDLLRKAAAHHILHGWRLPGAAQVGVHAVLQPREELVRVLVFLDVHGHAVVVLEAAPKVSWVVAACPAKAQVSKQHLQLVKHAVRLLSRLDERCAEHELADARLHEELLQHGVHVTRGAAIAQPDVLIWLAQIVHHLDVLLCDGDWPLLEVNVVQHRESLVHVGGGWRAHVHDQIHGSLASIWLSAAALQGNLHVAKVRVGQRNGGGLREKVAAQQQRHQASAPATGASNRHLVQHTHQLAHQLQLAFQQCLVAGSHELLRAVVQTGHLLLQNCIGQRTCIFVALWHRRHGLFVQGEEGQLGGCLSLHVAA